MDIGTTLNDLEINSSVAGFQQGGRLYAEAAGDIYITETQDELVVLAAKSTNGLVRLTVPDTNRSRAPPNCNDPQHPLTPEQCQFLNTTTDDLDLTPTGNSLVGQSDAKVTAPSTATHETLSGIWAKTNISLWVGDDVDEPAAYEIVAGGTITIHGDTNRIPGATAADDTPIR